MRPSAAGRLLLLAASTLAWVAAPAIAGVTIDHASLTVSAGGVEKIQVTAGGDAKNLQWTTSNPKVAQVYANGTVVGIAMGEAMITVAQTGQSPSAAAKCEVTVQQTAPPMVDISKIKQYPD